MKVLITGGAGYVGTELIRDLCLEDAVEQIIVYDNFSQTYGLMLQGQIKNSEKIKVVTGDILDNRKLKSVLSSVDSVIHLAAIVSTPYATENHHEHDQVNNWGTAGLIYAIEEASHIKKFIYLSSTSVYGFLIRR